MRIRKAVPDDIPALVRIEEACFQTDRISRRSFRHLLSRGHAVTLVAEMPDGGIGGYIMVLFNRGTSLARLYSFAVAPEHRRAHLGKALLEAAETAALNEGAAYMRLEVRTDNTPAISFYKQAGYRRFGIHEDYYDDHADALRMQKTLAHPLDLSLTKTPYYQQTLSFTCGPACAMMAMRAFDANAPMDRLEELHLWREATTIFMTSGHGGCGPYGLALALDRRGFDLEIYVSDNETMFIDSVRNETKKQVMHLVDEDFRDRVTAVGIPVAVRWPGLDEIKEAFDKGAVPIVLISTYSFDREKTPHWVVITGFDERFVYVHDPFVDPDTEKTETDCVNVPVPLRDFARMSRYGRRKHQAVLLVRGLKTDRPETLQKDAAE